MVPFRRWLPLLTRCACGLFQALVVAGYQELTPGTMPQALDAPANALSFHLKELAHSGLVTQAPDCRNLIYNAAFDQMSYLPALLMTNCREAVACLDVSATATSYTTC